jgi:hypothetical protein
MWMTEAKHESIDRPLGGKEGLIQATPGGLVHTLFRKGAGVSFSATIGSMEGTTGEPTFGGTAGDPSSGWGVKGITAGVFNSIEFLQLLFGGQLSKYGYLGCAVDGVVEGLADAGLYLWTFTLFNTSAIAKSKGKTAGTGFDYAERRRQLQAKQQRDQATARPEQTPVVRNAQRAAMVDPLAGYR